MNTESSTFGIPRTHQGVRTLTPALSLEGRGGIEGHGALTVRV